MPGLLKLWLLIWEWFLLWHGSYPRHPLSAGPAVWGQNSESIHLTLFYWDMDLVKVIGSVIFWKQDSWDTGSIEASTKPLFCLFLVNLIMKRPKKTKWIIENNKCSYDLLNLKILSTQMSFYYASSRLSFLDYLAMKMTNDLKMFLGIHPCKACYCR